jgi:hypothetical protein
VNPHSGWGQPPPGWHAPGWAPLVDPGPLPIRAVASVRRWLWPTIAIGGFLAAAGYVLGHDDPAPGLSTRGLLTIALAAVVVVLLTIRRAAGPGALGRATAEYLVVAVLAALLATLGVNLNPPPTSTAQASASPDRRPALVKTIDGFRDWLGEWRQWADTHGHPERTTTATTRPPAPASAPVPLFPSTRRML